MKMGFKQSPPPVLSESTKKEELSKGLNFASGGGGILEAMGAVPRSLGMGFQVFMFSKEVERLVKEKGTNSANKRLGNSLFIFSFGGNDIFRFLARQEGNYEQQSQQYISLLSNTFKENLLKVYNDGGRRFLVLGVANLGSTPMLRLRADNSSQTQEVENLTQRINTAIEEALRQLSSAQPNLKYSFFNTFNFSCTVLDNPQRYDGLSC